MDKDRLDRQIEFIREIDKEKSIGRQTYLADASRKEDDAEHAWHLSCRWYSSSPSICGPAVRGWSVPAAG